MRPRLTGGLARGVCACAVAIRVDAIFERSLLADAELTNAAELTGKVAVVRRGGCMFSEKARRAQAAGAEALLVVNTDDEAVGMGLPAEDIAI